MTMKTGIAKRMTLIVSLRTVDGIVLAGDSLATIYRPIAEVQGDADITCPNCNHKHTAPVSLPSGPSTATTLSYAQKIFPFFGEYGVGAFGNTTLQGKTAYFAVREYEKVLKSENMKPKTAEEAARLIGEYLRQLLLKDLELASMDANMLSDEWCACGVQVVGYDEKAPVTYEATIGKQVRINPFRGLDVTVNGDLSVFLALRNYYQQDILNVPLFECFSLQDAVEYAEFLIQTTAAMQKFSRRFPTVGGEIDIAVITPFDNFRWIRQKPLYERIMEATER